MSLAPQYAQNGHGLIASSPYKSPTKKRVLPHQKRNKGKPHDPTQPKIDLYLTIDPNQSDDSNSPRKLTPKKYTDSSPRSKGLLTTIFSPIYTFFTADGKKRNPEQECHESQSSGDEFVVYTQDIMEEPQQIAIFQGIHGGPPPLSMSPYVPRSLLRHFNGQFGTWLEDEFNPYLFIRSLPPLPVARRGQEKGILLPRKCKTSPMPTLVLDLDETLVHCTTGFMETPDFTFPVDFNSEEYKVSVKMRPHCTEFLARVAELYEVVVFTASQKVYADKLLNIMDPENKYIKHRLFRDSCIFVQGSYIKDLSILGRSLSSTLIVDNSPQAFGFHLDNGVPIESFFDDLADAELMVLLPFLEDLARTDDVRPVLRSHFQLHHLVTNSR
eukprot:TRINITY_DN15047_c0_g1::TRINITY_DN15047_c0_g1_i1::g.24982::m.24982 TRINITY_DN15047_c0_g1::TRINITY_DN15047_c0_g1_i1::g.24982  ORF type:complete len:384 (-),score=61.30,sp/Q5F3Z7/CTSL2_CHICK/41.57/2e-74,NIF/PF03031.13/2e-52 TRINITY_DN15047_c0_g1_i1:805-1956(-)